MIIPEILYTIVQVVMGMDVDSKPIPVNVNIRFYMNDIDKESMWCDVGMNESDLDIHIANFYYRREVIKLIPESYAGKEYDVLTDIEKILEEMSIQRENYIFDLIYNGFAGLDIDEYKFIIWFRDEKDAVRFKLRYHNGLV